MHESHASLRVEVRVTLACSKDCHCNNQLLLEGKITGSCFSRLFFHESLFRICENLPIFPSLCIAAEPFAFFQRRIFFSIMIADLGIKPDVYLTIRCPINGHRTMGYPFSPFAQPLKTSAAVPPGATHFL